MSSDAPKDFGGFLSSAQSRLPVPLGAISSSKSYFCSCSLLRRERKPLKLLQLCCTVCGNSSHQKGEEEKCLYLFKLIIAAPAEMWRQTERGDLICGVLLRKSIANLCIDFCSWHRMKQPCQKFFLQEMFSNGTDRQRVISSIAAVLLGSTTGRLNLQLLW